MNAEERAVARLLAFEAIHGVECESSYGGEPVTHRFTSCSTTEMITVRCERRGTWITESVPVRALDAVVSFKRFVSVRPDAAWRTSHASRPQTDGERRAKVRLECRTFAWRSRQRVDLLQVAVVELDVEVRV